MYFNIHDIIWPWITTKNKQIYLSLPCCAKLKYPLKGVLNIAYNPMMASMLHLSTPLGVLNFGTCRKKIADDKITI